MSEDQKENATFNMINHGKSSSMNAAAAHQEIKTPRKNLDFNDEEGEESSEEKPAEDGADIKTPGNQEMAPEEIAPFPASAEVSKI